MSVLAHKLVCDNLGFGLHELEILYRYVKEMNRMQNEINVFNKGGGVFVRETRLDKVAFEDLLREQCENRRKKVREVFENAKV
jgi:hypothetical protein